ncbi:PREDICTED: O(6)-methylguanine-induced apoptosis 2, partial [Pterocles gutturalis]|uniref:O(6)-methylguanine-induced apoptosis 2 n=1 Tax=Pterocles gutturalis TaxID=240206 RepID=UPI0005295429
FKISSSPYRKVISNSEKKGFNSQSKRFQYNQNETPGPGLYNVIHQSPEINSTSLSTKGTGYFPSLVPRTAFRKMSNYPAPNAYKIPSCFQSKQDFSQGNSSMFQQPIARKMEKMPTPAPNQYYTSLDFCKQSNNISGQAVFLSKTTRGFHFKKFGKWPSPYINDSLTKTSPRVITSFFKSKTSHLTVMDRFTPEPAIYQPRKPTTAAKKNPFSDIAWPKIKIDNKFLTVEKNENLRKAVAALTQQVYLYYISQQLYLMTGASPPCKDPPSPGPGQYELVDYKGSPKQDCSSAVFISNTGRWPVRRSQEGFPGPDSEVLLGGYGKAEADKSTTAVISSV